MIPVSWWYQVSRPIASLTAIEARPGVTLSAWHFCDVSGCFAATSRWHVEPGGDMLETWTCLECSSHLVRIHRYITWYLGNKTKVCLQLKMAAPCFPGVSWSMTWDDKILTWCPSWTSRAKIVGRNLSERLQLLLKNRPWKGIYTNHINLLWAAWFPGSQSQKLECNAVVSSIWHLHRFLMSHGLIAANFKTKMQTFLSAYRLSLIQFHLYKKGSYHPSSLNVWTFGESPPLSKVVQLVGQITFTHDFFNSQDPRPNKEATLAFSRSQESTPCCSTIQSAVSKAQSVSLTFIQSEFWFRSLHINFRLQMIRCQTSVHSRNRHMELPVKFRMRGSN